MLYREHSGYCFVSHKDSKEINQEVIAFIQKKGESGSKLDPCSQADITVIGSQTYFEGAVNNIV